MNNCPFCGSGEVFHRGGTRTLCLKCGGKFKRERPSAPSITDYQLRVLRLERALHDILVQAERNDGYYAVNEIADIAHKALKTEEK